MQEPHFINNQKISARQIKRTLTLELLGISTLLLPSLLATRSGVDGFFALATGGGFAWLLLKFWQVYFRQQDFSGRLMQIPGGARVCIQIFYGISFLGIAGYVLYLMTALMEEQLLGKAWEPVILLTLAAVACFGLVRGLESRVRVYEVLYWFLIVPLLFILVIACAGVDPNAWTPVAESSVSNFVKSSYLSFLFFSGASLYVFFQKNCQDKTAAYRGTRHALLVTVLLNLVIYLILLAVFHTELLANRRWPVIDLMAVVKLPGNFLERQDAVMVGIWFFCLFAFLDSMLYYAVDFFSGVSGKNMSGKPKRVLTGVLVLAAGGIGLFLLHRESAVEAVFHGYLYGVIPLMLLLPVFCRKKQKMNRILMSGMIFCILFFMISLCGCGVNELENQAFPLSMGVEAQTDGGFRLYLAYPDLQDEHASENALSADVYWEGGATDLFSGMRQMSENSSKNPDLNHLKVLLLNPQVFASNAAMEALLSFFEKETDAAWNTYVLLTDEPMEELFSENMQLPECMGIYLEDLLEEWEHVKHPSFVTVGTLMRQFYEQTEIVCIPEVVRQEEKLVIGGFVLLDQLQLAGNLSLEEGYQALLLQNNLKEYTFSLPDGSGVIVEQLQVRRSIVPESGETLRPVAEITIKGTWGITNRLEGSTEQEGLGTAAKQELERQLQNFVQQWQSVGCDVTDSYALLPGSDRGLWNRYKNHRKEYEKDLIYKIRVR